MQTAHSPAQAAYQPALAMARSGQPLMYDVPERVQSVLDRIAQVGLGPVLPADDFGLTPIARVHDAGYLQFLERAWRDWPRERGAHVALPQFWPGRAGAGGAPPRSLLGQFGYYAGDAIAPVLEGTWQAAVASAQTALTAQRWVAAGQRAAFALCRPPGHHAGRDNMAGYCYLNNAAIAAQAFIDGGAARVAVLDIDYHHGNGTQSIFYERADVLVASIHGDPQDEYPYFVGHAHETGRGTGAGCNLNCPLPAGSGWAAWSEALAHCCSRIAGFAPDALVVSLGVDGYKDDPSGAFRLESSDFLPAGRQIGALRLPTVFVFEGGYAAQAAGLNAVNVLQGFEDAA